MEHLNKRKPNLLFFWFLIPFVLYGAYSFGKLEGTRITVSNLQDILLYSLTHPWPPSLYILNSKSSFHSASDLGFWHHLVRGQLPQPDPRP